MKLLSPVKRFFYYYRTLEVNVYAAYAAYFILLSVFPAIMLTIAILQYTSISAVELEILLKGLVPESLGGLVDAMVRELFAADSVAVLSVSAVTALWMSSKGVYSLHRGLNKVYNQGIRRNGLVVRLECALFTLLLFAAMVFIIVRDCRCPYCGKIIFLGALSATHCPRCRRSLTTGKKYRKSKK